MLGLSVNPQTGVHFEDQAMATGVAVTNKVNGLIDSQKARLGLQSKEGLVHAIFMMALTDEAFLSKAAAMSRYLDEKGSEALETMGL
jgi:hypothetical protein